MPYRKSPLVTGEIYHIYNRSVAKQPIFEGQRNCLRAIETIDFYRFINPGLRFSFYNRLRVENKRKITQALYESGVLQVEIYAFCLMPNHFHFLLKQISEGGISTFLRLFQNSVAKYINTKTKRSGAAFQSLFKAVRIESDEQFAHVARYIHLNPLTSYLYRNIEDLETFLGCSYTDYLSPRPRPFIELTQLTKLHGSVENLLKFTVDQIDYQRSLQNIRHLAFDPEV